jgi:uncharacterized protein (TIGR01777 family)
MNIFITGGSGFVGTALSSHLLNMGHSVVSTGTSPAHKYLKHTNFRYISADTTQRGSWQDDIKNVDAVINLAGANILHFWTKHYKQKIFNSRILTTRNIVEALRVGGKAVLCSASATGYYGNCGDEILTEDSPAGNDFLAKVCIDWEKEALTAEEKGARVALMRFGVVLGATGGPFLKMALPFKFFAGGRLGDGRQWFPWIHIDDLVSAVIFIFENSSIKGPINFCAPEPERNRDFAREMGKALKRPSFLPMPAFLVKTVMGELGKSLLSSQRPVPSMLKNNGFTFRFPDAKGAIEDIT